MVYGIVTDYASSMRKAWRLIEEKYPPNICCECAAHCLNLIFCHMIKLETCKNIIKRAKGVIKEFRHKHMLLVDMLKAVQKAENVNCTLKLPVKTRWASMVTSLESVKRKQSRAAQNCCFRRARKKSSNLSEEIRRTLLNDTFWHESKAIVSILKSLQSAITQLREDSPNLALCLQTIF